MIPARGPQTVFPSIIVVEIIVVGIAADPAPYRGGDFLHTSLVILTCWSLGRRLKRSNLSPNPYFYNV